MTQKRWRIILCITILLVLVTGGHHHDTDVAASTGQRYHQPTLLIHGSRAGERTYNHFIELAQARHQAQYALTAVISDQHVRYYGDWRPAIRHPLVKVVFTNDHASWDNNATWLNHMLTQLRDHYHIHSFDAVAHSRGALDLLTAYSRKQPLRLERAVLIAGPYDGAYQRDDFPNANRILANGKPMVRNSEYRQLERESQSFPNGVHVLNVMGDTHWHGTNSDGKVANVSSESLWPAMGPRFASYDELLVHGHNASHHRLVRDNRQVANATMHFLWHE